jgi:branched-chain amino acid transport system permease protein
MSEIDLQRSAALPAAREKLKFYGIWVAVALCCWCCRRSSSGGALTTFSLIGISIIFSLSYNILLGQTGMLSFGHAVYYGLGGFLVVHAINIIGANKLPIPLPLFR